MNILSVKEELLIKFTDDFMQKKIFKNFSSIKCRYYNDILIYNFSI